MKRLLSFLFSMLMISFLAVAYGQGIVQGHYTGIGEYQMRGKTYYIESGSNEISSNDIEFRTYAEYLSQILQMIGAIPATDQLTADVCILLNYGIEDASYTETVSVPIWGPTGISSITTNTLSSGNVYGNASGYGSTYSSGGYTSGYGNVRGSARGSSNTMSTTSVTYNRGITGYHDVNRQVVQYVRYLDYYAYDNQQREGDPVMLWKMNGSSRGSSSSLSSVIPNMIRQSHYFIGRNLERTYTTYLDDDIVYMMKKKLMSSKNYMWNITYNNIDDL